MASETYSLDPAPGRERQATSSPLAEDGARCRKPPLTDGGRTLGHVGGDRCRQCGGGRRMDGSAVTALAALLGAAVGGLTSLTATLLTHRIQVRAQWLAQEFVRRQDLYNGFIEDASR